MGDLTLYTYDWVPEPPRGYVRDLRIRWALEEAKLPYRVKGVPFKDRGAEHVAHQPFAQVPWLTDGDLSIFESGAILLHLGNKSSALLPSDPVGRNEAVEWLIAALNSIEMASVPWSIFLFYGFSTESAEWKFFDGWVGMRLDRLEPVFAKREWLAVIPSQTSSPMVIGLGPCSPSVSTSLSETRTYGPILTRSPSFTSRSALITVP